MAGLAALVGLSSLLGAGTSLLGGYLSSKSAKDINDENRQVAIDLANTAHQREVKDLQAAGLNPWLSVQGSGAAVPSGVMSDTSSASAINQGFQGAARAISDLANLAIVQARINSAENINNQKILSNIAINSSRNNTALTIGNNRNDTLLKLGSNRGRTLLKIDANKWAHLDKYYRQ